MHPDLHIAGLRRERERLDKNAPDYEARKETIAAELEALEHAERPAIPVELDSLAIPDARRTELTGLRRELERAPEEQHPQINAQIKQIEQELGGDVNQAAQDQAPSEQEIEERKQARTGRKVEQARNAPAPDQPAPASAKE